MQVMFHFTVLYAIVCVTSLQCLYIGRSYDHIQIGRVTTNDILMQYVALTPACAFIHASLIVTSCIFGCTVYIVGVQGRLLRL